MIVVHRCLLAVVILFVLMIASVGHATTIYSRFGAHAQVNPSVASRFQCLVNKIDASGYRIRYMTGYTRARPSYSWHPFGRALDIDQRARNRAPVPRATTHWANECGLFAGAQWRKHPDFGHFQVGSGSPRYAGHPIHRPDTRGYHRYALRTAQLYRAGPHTTW